MADLYAVPGSGELVERLTKLAFRSRFTLAEQVALRQAEMASPDTTLRATLAVIRESLAEAEYVDVLDPRTQMGAAVCIDALVGLGLVAPGEREARLAALLAPLAPLEPPAP